MTPQPDKLFRDKLEGFQLNTPTNAWSKVESGLNKSSRLYFWMKIAAGVLVLVLAGSLIWNSMNPDRTSDVVTNQETKVTPESIHEPVENIQKPLSPTPPTVISELKSGSITKPVIKEKKNESYIAITNLIEEKKENANNEISQSPVLTSSTSEVIIATKTTPELSEIPAETSAHVYLVYTAKEVNAKYMKKSTSIDTNTVGKKSSTVEILLGIASNVKNGEHGLGDLREMKDEFLTLNFQKNKN